LSELRAMVDRKEMDPHQVIMKALSSFAEDNTLARKMARRARIKRQFGELDGTEWDFGRDGDASSEENSLKKLQQLRQLASFEEWSDDDEDEEEDEEEDDDDGEEVSGDDWETEDEGIAEEDD